MAAGTNKVCLLVEAGLAVVAVVALRLWRAAALGLVALVASTAVAITLKAVIQRPRPPSSLALVHPVGSSMPSTNTAQFAAAVVAVGWVLVRRWPDRRLCIAVLCATSVVWVAFCVVYLGAHWPSDAVVGAALGCGVGAGVALVPERLERSR